MSQYINDIKVSVNKTEESEYRGQGYKQVPQKLNNGTSGNEIHLWYKTGQTNAITRIQFSFTDDMTKGLIEEGYEKGCKNLNEFVYGGKPIYLWFYRGSTEYDFPITKILITTNVDAEAQKFHASWERLACDLNWNPAGDWHYMWVKREKPLYICDVTATDNFEGDADKFKEGYIRVDENTNRNAGGNCVFIWYRLTTDDQKALRDLQVSVTEEEYEDCQSQGYSPVNQNLNEGTEGPEIYLWYKRDGPENPIKGVSIIINTNAVTPYKKAGINVIEKNLNTGNCGDVEYVCFSV